MFMWYAYVCGDSGSNSIQSNKRPNDDIMIHSDALRVSNEVRFLRYICSALRAYSLQQKAKQTQMKK